METREVKISVRSLVEFMLRSGDIDSMSGTEAVSLDAMREGAKTHRKLQKEAGPSYQAEVPLQLSTQLDDGLVITVSGRADGIITEAEIGQAPDGSLAMLETVTVDEIKGTYKSLRNITEPVPVHLAQAMCYSCFYLMEKYPDAADRALQTEDDVYEAEDALGELGNLYVQMTYVHMKSGRIKRFKEKMEPQKLLAWYDTLIRDYAVWVRFGLAWKKTRDASISDMHFPYDFRPGQKRLLAGVYQTIAREKRLFAMAPTGTGKTLAALYPAIQAMGRGMAERIFYLTGKTITRTVAEDTLRLLRGQGASEGKADTYEEAGTVSWPVLRLKSVTLTAKDKICIFEKAQCSPQLCPRAKGHFDRINDALFALISGEEMMDRECILRYAKEYDVCPFELQLDASLWCDVIIGDYNYVFDPDVYLKRFFVDKGGEYIFLVDEAHNLVERARGMYSASLSLGQLNDSAKKLKGLDNKLTRRLSRCRTILREMRREIEEEEGERSSAEDAAQSTALRAFGKEVCRVHITPGKIEEALASLQERMEELLKEEMETQSRADLIELYFSVRKFLNACDRFSDKYLRYSIKNGKHFELKISCIDPSADLGERLAKGRSAVFFSATLLPVRYYKEMLSPTADEDYELYTESPFDPARRLLIMARDVSSRYARRGPAEYEKIAKYIFEIIRARHGNYLVFFPSYKLMNDVYEAFAGRYLTSVGHGLQILFQKPEMSEEERADFLAQFAKGSMNAVTGLCVMGGIFAEGIDLTKDKLIGVIVVGTGLPQVGPERELLKDYFDRNGDSGFDYAYLYPGMNKVLQAAGRVIRTQTDEGVIALLDERFSYRQYRQLFPREWSDIRKVDRESVGRVVEDFWTGREEKR